jgi:hypothetical protein
MAANDGGQGHDPWNDDPRTTAAACPASGERARLARPLCKGLCWPHQPTVYVYAAGARSSPCTCTYVSWRLTRHTQNARLGALATPLPRKRPTRPGRSGDRSGPIHQLRTCFHSSPSVLGTVRPRARSPFFPPAASRPGKITARGRMDGALLHLTYYYYNICPHYGLEETSMKRNERGDGPAPARCKSALCYTDTPRGDVFVSNTGYTDSFSKKKGYTDIDTRVYYFSGFFLRKCIFTYLVSDTRTVLA